VRRLKSHGLRWQLAAKPPALVWGCHDIRISGARGAGASERYLVDVVLRHAGLRNRIDEHHGRNSVRFATFCKICFSPLSLRDAIGVSNNGWGREWPRLFRAYGDGSRGHALRMRVTICGWQLPARGRSRAAASASVYLDRIFGSRIWIARRFASQDQLDQTTS
jgi:hypothetical protein